MLEYVVMEGVNDGAVRYLPTRSPLPAYAQSAISLRARSALSGTDLAYLLRVSAYVRVLRPVCAYV
eukprot:1600964-Rhodomonas_salina.1